MKQFPGAFFAVLSIATPIAAEELRPLKEWVQQPGAEADIDQQFTRCAALFIAFDQFGETNADQRIQFTYMAEFFGTRAMKAKSDREGGAPEAQLEAVASDVAKISKTYGESIKRSRETTGKDIAGASLLVGDTMTCLAFFQYMNKRD